MSLFTYCYAECHYAKCSYAVCHYIEFRYGECRYSECRYAERCYAECLCASSSSKEFCESATFEMTTTHFEMRLLNDQEPRTQQG